MTRSSVVIVGGGISGLSAAWELSGGASGPSATTPRIEVVEQGPLFGGALRTTEFAGRTIDLGADGFLARRPEAVRLVRELGHEDNLEPIGASGAWIWLDGALRELPTGLVLGVPTSARQVRSVQGLSWRSRLNAWRDTFVPKRAKFASDASIGDIVRTKLGRELSYQFIEPMIGGIQAGRIDQLSAKSVFPALLTAAQKGGSLMKAIRPQGPVNPGPQAATSTEGPVFFSLTNGVGSLASMLVRQLEERGVVLRANTSVTALRRTPAGMYPWEVDCAETTTPANFVVMATPAPTVAQLLGAQHPDLEALGTIASAGAAMISFHFSETDIELPPTGTGVLVPLGTAWSGEGSLLTTAITFLDRKWQHLKRDGDVVLRVHVGRSDDTRWTELSDEELTQRVTLELQFILKKMGAPLATRVQRWPLGLPQYLVGHEELVARARAASASMQVSLAGNAYDGVGIPASIGSGRVAASEALASLL